MTGLESILRLRLQLRAANELMTYLQMRSSELILRIRLGGRRIMTNGADTAPLS
jgi:hypothetical protein